MLIAVREIDAVLLPGNTARRDAVGSHLVPLICLGVSERGVAHERLAAVNRHPLHVKRLYRAMAFPEKLIREKNNRHLITVCPVEGLRGHIETFGVIARREHDPGKLTLRRMHHEPEISLLGPGREARRRPRPLRIDDNYRRFSNPGET